LNEGTELLLKTPLKIAASCFSISARNFWLSSFFPFSGIGAQIQVLYSSENNVLLLSKLTQDSHINITVLKNLCCSAKRMASHKL
jgi:hypothetical protein